MRLTDMLRPALRSATWWRGFLAVVITLASVALFFYLGGNHAANHFIQSSGAFGGLAAVALMAVICVTPIPSEGLLLVYFRAFGVAYGLFYAWTGLMVGTLATFVIARVVGRPLLSAFYSTKRLVQVEEWVAGKGTFGLLMVRLLPLPAVVINYASGMVKTVRLFPFLWAAGVSILPYYLATVTVYEGVSRGLWMFALLGIVPVALLAFFGARLRRGRP